MFTNTVKKLDNLTTEQFFAAKFIVAAEEIGHHFKYIYIL